MCAAVLTGLSPLIITLPLAHKYHFVLGKAIANAPNFWAKPSLGDLGVYREMVNQPLLLLTATLLVFLVTRGREPMVQRDLIPVPAYEWAAVGALCLLLPRDAFVLCRWDGILFLEVPIGTSLGFGSARRLGTSAFRSPAKNRAAPTCLEHIFLPYYNCVVLDFLEFVSPAWRVPVARNAVSPLLLRASGELQLSSPTPRILPRVVVFSADPQAQARISRGPPLCGPHAALWGN